MKPSWKKSWNSGRWGAFALSLLFHITLLLCLFLTPQNWFQAPKKEVVEVDFVASQPLPNIPPAALPAEKMAPLKRKTVPLQNQVVEQDDKQLNEEVPDNTRFLSAHNQVVKKQTMAAQHGDFKNSGESMKKAGKGTAAAQSDFTAAPQPLDLKPEFNVEKAVENHLEMEREKEQALLLNANQKTIPAPQKFVTEGDKKTAPENGSGQAAVDDNGSAKDQASQTLDYVKDIDQGLQTLLSTKEFVYYTYYNRIRHQLNQYWGPKVKEHLTKLYASGRKIASADDRITKLLVTLDRQGNLVKAQIIGDSGVTDLDEAAVEAFRSAAPFPHPPKGMVDPDGNIKIRWDFILEG